MPDNVGTIPAVNAPAPANNATPAPVDNKSTGDSGLFDSNSNTENVESQELSSDSEIDAAVEDGELSKAEAKELKKKLKLKIDGKEEEFELDFNDEEGLKKHLQKSRSFDKRLQEFSGLKSDVQKFMDELKNSPESVLEKLGIDVDGMSEKRIQKKIEELSKSPEQIEREKMQAELEQLRKEKEEAAKAKEIAEQEALMNKTAMEIESSIISAMESAKTILPKNNPEVIGQIAKAMKEAMAKGYNEVTVEDVVHIVEKRYKEQLAKLFDVLPEDAIEMVVGKNNLERLRKKRISKAQVPTIKQLGKDTGTSALEKSRAENKEEKPKKSYREFFKS